MVVYGVVSSQANRNDVGTCICGRRDTRSRLKAARVCLHFVCRPLCAAVCLQNIQYFHNAQCEARARVRRVHCLWPSGVFFFGAGRHTYFGSTSKQTHMVVITAGHQERETGLQDTETPPGRRTPRRISCCSVYKSATLTWRAFRVRIADNEKRVTWPSRTQLSWMRITVTIPTN